jgi:hypothetical protein
MDKDLAPKQGIVHVASGPTLQGDCKYVQRAVGCMLGAGDECKFGL